MKDIKAAQLKTLVANGMSVEDAAENLGIELETALHYLDTELTPTNQSAEDFRASKKLAMWHVLAEIAEDVTGENISARVQAARAFVDDKDEQPEVPLDKLNTYYKKMKDVVTKQQSITPISVTNPSPSTIVVDVKNPINPTNSSLKEGARPLEGVSSDV